MRLTDFAAAAMGSVVALAGFANAADASATIDLIWADTGTSEIRDVDSSSQITLQVILTAGPNGSQGAGVSVDYSAALESLSVLGYASTPGGELILPLGTTTDSGTQINNINSACLPTWPCNGLQTAGESHMLGTVTFHKFAPLHSGGRIEVRSNADGPTDAVLDLAGRNITSTTTFNSAYLIDPIPEPCNIAIEINALRGGSPTVSVGETKDITAKARIPKGTAVRGTTFDTTLQIDAIDGSDFIDSQSSGPIRLEVGKGGHGDTLAMNIDQCSSGIIQFRATFFGTYRGARCGATRTIAKTCK